MLTSRAPRRFLLLALAVSLPAALLVGAPAAPAAPSGSGCTLKPGGSCAGADLRGRDLSGRDLHGIDLRRARLDGTNLSGANLRGATLRAASLVGADLRTANLVGANLVGADARQADFGGARLDSALLRRTRLNPDDRPLIVFPRDIGKVAALLDTARETIDFVIYELGGPSLVGQAGAPGALMRAVSRGVKVRVLINGNWRQCSYDDTTRMFVDQYSCATVYTPADDSTGYNGTGKASPTYAVQESLMAAYRDPDPGVTPVLPQVQFANTNFQVTHEKTILVDSTYPSGAQAGQPRAAEDMLPSSRALVMTGNLLSFGWGSSRGSAADDTTWMADPDGTCRGACPSENPARDFGVPVTDPTLISEVARVFASDFLCGATRAGDPPSRTNTNDLLQTPFPLTWSNGSFQAEQGATPTEYPGTVFGYEFSSSRYPVEQTQQGNVRERMLDIINGAQHSLLLYNEEFSDREVIAAVQAAAQRLGRGRVKLVMTWNPWSNTSKPAPSIWRTWKSLDDSGVAIMLSEYKSPYAQDDTEIYVHAKVIVADNMDAYAGSTNFTSPSMDWNRELGLQLTNRKVVGGAASGWIQSVRAIRDLVTTFSQDFTSADMTSWKRSTSPTRPKARPVIIAHRMASDSAGITNAAAM
ncbi:MAG: pentapeptide repeat-containing protein, partial [bacterium]